VGATASSGGLTVRLTASPAPADRGSVVRIQIAATAQRAPGALGYILRYGDGTTSGAGAIPQFCLSGASRLTRQTWRLAHRYRTRGRYAVSVSAYVNCTHDRVSATALLQVN
jgi:hypothetical protein